MKEIKTGSDFSGVGAFDYAMQRVSEAKGFIHKRIYACDFDKYARITYQNNHGVPDYYPENVYDREIPTDSLGIFMTSPPCQDFSISGKRPKVSDKTVLFLNSHEFIKVNKPRFFIFENVKGLLSHNSGLTFSEWLNFLAGKSINGQPILFPDEESVPYHIYHKVINSKHHGIPQNRERIFIVGIRDDVDNSFTFPKEEHLSKRLKDILEKNVDEKYYLTDKMIKGLKKEGTEFEGVFQPHSENDISKCVTARYFKMGATDPYIKEKFWIADYRNDEGLRIRKDEIAPCMTSRRNSENDISTMCALTNEGFKDKIRRLTPRECFRLQDLNKLEIQ